MYKTVLLFLIPIALISKITVVSTVPPIGHIIKTIGGDSVETVVMVPSGQSPHNYEPKPSQLKTLSKARLYFTVGVEFETLWLDRFRSLNPSLDVIALDSDVAKIPMERHNDAHEHSRKHHRHDYDPHIWTSPPNLRKIAHTIAHTLSKRIPHAKEAINRRLEHYLQKLEKTDQKIRKLIKTHPKIKAFVAYHPSWGYYAKTYRLKQLVIEKEGKRPGPRALAALIEEAKRFSPKAVIVPPGISDKSASIVAQTLGARLTVLSALQDDILLALMRLTHAVLGLNDE